MVGLFRDQSTLLLDGKCVCSCTSEVPLFCDVKEGLWASKETINALSVPCVAARIPGCMSMCFAKSTATYMFLWCVYIHSGLVGGNLYSFIIQVQVFESAENTVRCCRAWGPESRPHQMTSQEKAMSKGAQNLHNRKLESALADISQHVLLIVSQTTVYPA